MDAEKLVEDLRLEQVLVWADLLNVEYTKQPWLDDDYPVRENAVRAALVDEINKRQQPAPTPTPSKSTLPAGVRLRLSLLMRDALIGMLYDKDTEASVCEEAEDNFSPGDAVPGEEEYDRQVGNYCTELWSAYYQALTTQLQNPQFIELPN